jgi:hypothetical protein
MTESESFAKLRAFDESWRVSYMEAGIIARQVHDGLLWKERCANFHEWIREAAPYGFATVYRAMEDVRSLSDIPDDHLAKITQANVPIVRQLSTAVRNNPAVLEAAQTKPSSELLGQIRRDYPDQHLEAKKALRFSLDESAAAKIEEALTMAMARGAHNRSEALEAVAQEAMVHWEYDAKIEEAFSNFVE